MGPVLFLNDLPLFIKETYLDSNADDSTVHTANKKQNCHSNETTKLVLQISKNGVYEMTAGTRQILNRNDALEINMDGEMLRAVDNQKLLGIVIDKHLTFDNQIDSVCLNITRRITILKLYQNTSIQLT